MKVKRTSRSSLFLAAVAVVSAAGAVTLPQWVDIGLGDLSLGLTVAPDGVSAAERLTMPGSLRASFLGLAEGDTLAVQDWPVAPGAYRRLTFRRADVYAPDAPIYVVDAGGTREVARSKIVFLRGEDGDGEAQALLALDPDTDGFTGMSVADGEAYEILAPAGAAPGDIQLVPRAGLLPPGAKPLRTLCSNEELPRIADGLDLEPRAPGALSLASRHYVVVAVDTDSELLALKFANNTTSAVNYLADVFARMNVFYERDLNLHLALGTTFLRVGEPDPYAQGPSGGASPEQLYEFGDYWAANYGSVPRGLAAMFSGKSSSSNSAAGIAWIGGTCSSSYGYSFSMVFKVNYNAGDASLVGHELGHDAGAHHTHCLVPPADTCSNQGCTSGTLACPAPATINGQPNVRGTLMSYCHTLGGCSKSDVFHERSEAETDAHLGGRIGVCVFPGSGPPAPTPTIIAGGAPTPTPTRTPTPTATPTPPPSGPATSFYTLTPCRLLDTREATGPAAAAPSLAPLARRNFTVIGRCSVPAGAKAVSANIIVADSSSTGALRVVAGDLGLTAATSISFGALRNRANNTLILLATDGSGTIGVQNDASASVNFILDVNGYFQ